MVDPFCYSNYNLIISGDDNTLIKRYNNDDEDMFSFYEEIMKFLFSLIIFFFGLIGSSIFVAIFIFDPLIKKDLPLLKIYADEEKQAKIEMEFLETNYDVFDDLSMNDLSDNYNNEYFIMETPKGKVFMSYDKELKLFNYYSDKKEIPNKYLQCIARNFVIKFDCKLIYIDSNEEIQKVLELKKEQDNRLKNQEKNKEIKQDDVFAKFKNYNEKNIQIIPERSNIFKYKGKILDYENDILKVNNSDILDEYIEVDYQNFKNK